MKILLIHGDTTPWATHNRALELKKRWTEDEVTISSVYNYPRISNFDIVHILFSGGITQMKMEVMRYPEKFYGTLASQRTLEYIYDKKQDLIDVYRTCKKTVAQNLKLREDLIKLIGEEYRDKIVYIPNGVDEEVFKKDFTVGFVGNQQMNAPDHKGLHLIMEACEELGLKVKAINNTYPDNVIPNSEMPEHYKEMDCLVIPSLSEGCNNPTLEALAMNIPVISTRVGIAEELEGVILVERTARDIKEVLKELSKQPRREQILKNYTWDIIAKRYHDLYEA